jgi:hypothetical protein
VINHYTYYFLLHRQIVFVTVGRSCFFRTLTHILPIGHSVKKLLDASPKGTYKGIIPVDFAGANNLEEFRKVS